MPTIEQENAVRDNLKATLETLLNVDPKRLAREAELGTTLSFTEAIPFFERIINLYKRIDLGTLESVSFGALNNVLGGINEALKLFSAIQNFNPQQGPNPSETRKNFINMARDQYESHYNRVSPVLAFAARKDMDFNEFERKANSALESLDKAANTVVNKGKVFEGNAEDVLRKLQEAAGKVGVAKHAVNFEEQSKEHEGVAKWWFWATVLAVVMGVVAVWALFMGPLKIDVTGLELGEAIYHVASRIMAFSVLSFAIYWTAKNHGAHRHNYVINKHRQNALATFQAFTEAAKLDPDVKAAVLLQASQAIYTSQSTGYSEAISAPPNPVNMVEIIKCVTSKN
jgi:tetratricopeptide (TPR) repeat protein